jgi:hypothetical protein
MRLCLVLLPLNGLKNSKRDMRTLKNDPRSEWLSTAQSLGTAIVHEAVTRDCWMTLKLCRINCLLILGTRKICTKFIPLSLTGWLILPRQWSAWWQISMWWRSAIHLRSELAQANFFYSLNWKTHCISYFLPWSST